MKKCKERRTITRALVLYQRLGLCECSSPFLIFRKIYGICGKSKALAADLFALHECLLFLRIIGDSDTVKAIDYIYFKPFRKNVLLKDKKNEISYLTVKFAMENHMDVRTVYRKLEKAKKMFFALRDIYN